MTKDRHQYRPFPDESGYPYNNYQEEIVCEPAARVPPSTLGVDRSAAPPYGSAGGTTKEEIVSQLTDPGGVAGYTTVVWNPQSHKLAPVPARITCLLKIDIISGNYLEFGRDKSGTLYVLQTCQNDSMNGAIGEAVLMAPAMSQTLGMTSLNKQTIGYQFSKAAYRPLSVMSFSDFDVDDDGNILIGVLLYDFYAMSLVSYRRETDCLEMVALPDWMAGLCGQDLSHPRLHARLEQTTCGSLCIIDSPV